jgi:excisionase family DNA binding protein
MDRYLTTAEVAERLRVTPRTVNDWVRRGKIRSVSFIGQRRQLIPESALEELRRK